jgi:hypothetical protein
MKIKIDLKASIPRTPDIKKWIKDVKCIMNEEGCINLIEKKITELAIKGTIEIDD